MFKRALAILVIGTASATAVGAHASDWNIGAPRHVPAERNLNDRAEAHGDRIVRHAPPRYVVPYRYAPPARWAAPPYRSYRWANGPYRVWHPAYAYRGYGYRSKYSWQR